jgi:hypothetical protein
MTTTEQPASSGNTILYVSGIGYINAKSAAKLGFKGEQAYDLPEPEVIVARPPRVAVEPDVAWYGARYAPANDNRPVRRWTGEENYGPDESHKKKQDNPGASRDFEGDIISRLVAEEDVEAAYVLRAVGQLLTPTGLLAANDSFAQDADIEMDDGFGMDYAMEQPEADAVIEKYLKTGKAPGGYFKFRQRSGSGGKTLTAKHRAELRRGVHVDRYLSLRGVAELPAQKYFSDGVPLRSHAPKNAEAARKLAKACDNTDWRRVTWIRYPPMGARVYGDLSIFCTAKGAIDGGTTTPEHDVVRELRRSGDEAEFRKRMSERSMRVIDAALNRNTYTKIAETEGLSRNGAKGAVIAALKEAWGVLTDITGEEMPEKKIVEEKIAA